MKESAEITVSGLGLVEDTETEDSVEENVRLGGSESKELDCERDGFLGIDIAKAKIRAGNEV